MFLTFRAETAVDTLYIFRKLIVLVFCSFVNYIDQLTVSVAITDFSPWGMVGVSWPIFDRVSWHIFNEQKIFGNQFSIL